MKIFFAILLATTFLSSNSFCSDILEIGEIHQGKIDLSSLPKMAQKVIKGLEKDNISEIPREGLSQFFTEKYHFFDEELDVSLTKKAILSGKIGECSVEHEFLMAILQGYQANDRAQEALYQYLAYKVGPIDLRDPERAQNLLETALKEKRFWAIKKYEQTPELLETLKDRFELIIILANNGNESAIPKVQEKYKITLPHLKNVRSVESIDKTINELMNQCEKISCGVFFRKMALHFQHKSEQEKPKSKNKKLYKKAARKFFLNAAKLEDTLAIVEYLPFKKNASVEEVEKYVVTVSKMMNSYKGSSFLSQILDQVVARVTAIYESFGDKLRSKKGAYDFLIKAGDFKNMRALSYIGNIASSKKLPEWISKQELLDSFRKGADLGNPTSLYNVGYTLLQVKDGAPDYTAAKEALEINLKLIKELSSEEKYKDLVGRAHFNLGTFYEDGLDGSQPDFQKALEHYYKAMEGSPEAKYRVAMLYQDGYGEIEDREKVIYKFFEEASEAKYPPASAALGEYILEKFQSQSRVFIDRAYHYFQEAYSYFKDNGDIKSLEIVKLNMAICLWYGGEEEKQDQKRAFDLFVEIKNAGNLNALVNVAVALGFGFPGQERDLKTAEAYLLEAIDRGVDDAYLTLGSIYLEHNDIPRAINFFNQAKQRGIKRAKDFLEECLRIKETTEEVDLERIHSELIKDVQKPLNTKHLNTKHSDKSDSESQIMEGHKVHLSDETEADIEEAMNKYNKEMEDYRRQKKVLNKATIIRGMKTELNDLSRLSPEELQGENYSIFKDLKANQAVKPTELIKLCSDKIFRNSIVISFTKKGYTFFFSKGISVGTHRKHNKSYKGVDSSFAKKFYQALNQAYFEDVTDSSIQG
ncbi:MAG: sel1 repeat family protein [Candidatus Paracaedimonas acanthamoebae]|uniref:Sel1 repeat family protein n=1 Tax=Candidatus Paracaedimonas acanthamoebae TaxID=244581 RepID=A0A8J7TTS5_9PROT|nr:sel1 repeat family protein [Candidatus Paracaedimonas acanthamoebae]